MKAKFIEISSILIIMVALSGCGHQHSFTEATCIEPKTCSVCGETEGEALGHTWLEADCDNPKTCSVCGATEGEALGHTWMEADCDSPKTCSVCGATDGKALGHMVEVGWCSRCNTTQNEDLVQEIQSNLESMQETTTNMTSIITSANTYFLDDVYIKICRAQLYYDTVERNMQNICDLCKGYSELHEIKKQAKKILKAIPQKISGNDRNSVIKGLTDYNNYLKKVRKMYIKCADIIASQLEGSDSTNSKRKKK